MPNSTPATRVIVQIAPGWVERNRVQGQKYIERAIAYGVEACGYTGTLLVTQDPSNPNVFSVITIPIDREGEPPPFMTIVSEESVQLPVRPRTKIPEVLDRFIPYDEAVAVAYVLGRETDKKHILTFSETLLPDYPIAAMLLKARAALLDRRPRVKTDIASLRRATQGMGAGVEDSWATIADDSGPTPWGYAQFIELPGGIMLPNARVIRESQRKPPKAVSPTAIATYSTMTRPGRTIVQNPSRVSERIREMTAMASRGDRGALKGRDELMRAQKLVERRKWIEQYHRLLRAEKEGAPTFRGSLTGRLW